MTAYYITVTPHGRHDEWNHQQVDFFNSFLQANIKENILAHITGPLSGNPFTSNKTT